MKPEDLKVRRVTYADRVGETSAVYATDDSLERHSWLYFPGMTRGEAMLLKTWDTPPNPGEDQTRSLFAVHAAAALAGVDALARPRVSIEMRCFLLYDPAAKDLFKDRPNFEAPHITRKREGGAVYERVDRVSYHDEDPDAWVPPTQDEFAI